MEAAWEDSLEEEAEQKECWVVKWLGDLALLAGRFCTLL